MGIFFLCLPLLVICQIVGSAGLFAELAEPFHYLCRHFEPISEFREAYGALVCGSNLSKSELRDALQSTSLLHLAIVSGSHLLLLEAMADKVLKKSRRKHLYISSLLFIYSLLTGWQAPAVRAVVGRWLALYNERCRLHWTALQTTWYAGWLTWALFPQWTESFSLLLSWGASLGLAMASNFDASTFARQWKIHLLVYLTLLPVLLPLSPPHPLSVLCNWLAGPLLGTLLFPLSLAAFLVPWLVPLCDLFWKLSAWVVIWLSQWTPVLQWRVDTPILYLWIYLLALHSVTLLLEIRQLRRQWHAA